MIKKMHMPKKLTSNNGFLLSIVIYPVLILLLTFSIAAFVTTHNLSRQTEVHYELLKAEFSALQGIEYAFIEIKYQAFGGASGFITHTVEADGQLVSSSTPTTRLASIDPSDNSYALDDADGNPIFRVKVYTVIIDPTIGKEFCILSKGASKGRQRLFVNKIGGSSLYEYFNFWSGPTHDDEVRLGWQTFDAMGGKMHANANISFQEGIEIKNVLELNSSGKMFLRTSKHFFPGEEHIYGTHFPNDAPRGFGISAEKGVSTPWGCDKDGVCLPTLPNGKRDYVSGSYFNGEGHYTGDEPYLYVWDKALSEYKSWLPTWDDLDGDYRPISPWPWENTDGKFYIKKFNEDGDGVYEYDEDFETIEIRWARTEYGDFEGAPALPSGWNNHSYIYQEDDKNCAVKGKPCGSEDYKANNAYLRNGYTVKINEWNIPPRIAGGDEDKAYEMKKYYDWAAPTYAPYHNDTMPALATDSEELETAWDAFIASIERVYDPETYPHVVTGLDGVVKAGEKYGVSHISPPKPQLEELTNLEGTIVIKLGIRNPDYDPLVDHPSLAWKYEVNSYNHWKYTVIVNGADLGIVSVNPNNRDDPISQIEVNDCDDGDPRTIFHAKNFMNNYSGRSNTAVEVNIGEIRECLGDDGEGNTIPIYAPKDGIIVSKETDVAAVNAEQLFDRGITWVVNGNFLMVGNYNNPEHLPDDWVKPETEGGTDEPWTWEPSGAIIADDAYTLSAAWDYPETLRVPAVNANYPYESSYCKQGDCEYDSTGNCISGDCQILPACGDSSGGQSCNVNIDAGYNWYAAHNPDDPDHPEDPAPLTPYKMPNKAWLPSRCYEVGSNCADSKGYDYNISLIGSRAWAPKVLEMWIFYEDPGDHTTAPLSSDRKKYTPTVTGAFVQLKKSEFDDYFPDDADLVYRTQCTYLRQYRKFDIYGNDVPDGFPCRSYAYSWPNEGNYFTFSAGMTKHYEPKYIIDIIRPPGDFIGLFQTILLELDLSFENWTRHPCRLGGVDPESCNST